MCSILRRCCVSYLMMQFFWCWNGIWVFVDGVLRFGLHFLPNILQTSRIAENDSRASSKRQGIFWCKSVERDFLT